jgi:hypothetical protein
MKKILFFLAFMLSIQAIAQMKMDTAQYRNLVNTTPVITPKELCANKWKTKTSMIQWFAYDDVAASYEETEEMGYVYTFSPDGTYTVDAILDTDGLWTIDSSTKIVDMRNNLTRIANQHAYMILKGNTLTWYEWTEAGLFVTVLEKTDGVYDNE